MKRSSASAGDTSVHCTKLRRKAEIYAVTDPVYTQLANMSLALLGASTGLKVARISLRSVDHVKSDS